MSRKCKSCSSRSWGDRLAFLFLVAGILLVQAVVSCQKDRTLVKEPLRVGLALYSQEDTFIYSIAQNMERLARELETDEQRKINLSTANGRRNQTVQLEQVDQFIERDYDVLCVNIVDRTAAAVIVDKAKAAGVPLIFFNRQPVAEDIRRWNRTYYVGANAREGGRLQGEIVLDAWLTEQDTLDKNRDGVLQYVMLEGEPGHQDALLRTEYSVKALTDAGVPVEKLAGDTANWSRGQASALIQRWIEEFGANIEVVFSNNDDMALGAIDSFREAGLPIPLVVGVDATDLAQEAVRAGQMRGTVLNDAQGIAQTILDLTLTLEGGGDLTEKMDLSEEHYIWLPYQKLTKAELERRESRTARSMEADTSGKEQVIEGD